MRKPDYVYPFGVDPVWSTSAQDLTFYNSLKMKMSVTIGVIQMTFGVVLSLSNKVYFQDTAGIVLEFIPQMLFMLCLFGYMIFLYKFPAFGNLTKMYLPRSQARLIKLFFSFFSIFQNRIIFKWCTDYSLPGAKSPPNLIQTMMGMVLKPGQVRPLPSLFFFLFQILDNFQTRTSTPTLTLFSFFSFALFFV